MTLEELTRMLDSDSRACLQAHESEDAEAFALAHAAETDLPVRAIAEQIACRRKARAKLPFLSDTGFLYDSRALEQCSSESTARYHASLVGGRRGIDITGGLGIDTLHLAEVLPEMHYCEADPVLGALFSHNADVLGGPSVDVHVGDSLQTLAGCADRTFDWLFADPDRRDAHGRHVVLERCRPDIVASLPLLCAKASHVLVKASPLLEPADLRASLPGLCSATFVSSRGECRELVLSISAEGGVAEPPVRAVVLDAGGAERYAVERTDMEDTPTGQVGAVLFDPDPAVLRARLWARIAEQTGLHAVNRTCGLLTGDTVPEGVPGRGYWVEAVMRWHRSKVRSYLRDRGVQRAVVMRREFPAPADRIRTLLGLADGGLDTLVLTTDCTGAKICVHARRED